MVGSFWNFSFKGFDILRECATFLNIEHLYIAPCLHLGFEEPHSQIISLFWL